MKKSAEILRRNSQIYSIQGGDAGKCVDYSQIKAIQNGYMPYYMYRQKNTVGNYENVGFSNTGLGKSNYGFDFYKYEQIFKFIEVFLNDKR